MPARGVANRPVFSRNGSPNARPAQGAAQRPNFNADNRPQPGAAQGRGPKLVFLRALTTLLAAAQAAFDQNTPASQPGENPADPYMTALCYFNALRELGGARRIVEDEVRDRVGRYGTQRRRVDPKDSPFVDRTIKEPMERSIPPRMTASVWPMAATPSNEARTRMEFMPY